MTWISLNLSWETRIRMTKKKKNWKKNRISSENQVTISQSSKLTRHVDALHLKFSIWTLVSFFVHLFLVTSGLYLDWNFKFTIEGLYYDTTVSVIYCRIYVSIKYTCKLKKSVVLKRWKNVILQFFFNISQFFDIFFNIICIYNYKSCKLT